MRARRAAAALALCLGLTACAGGADGEETAPTLPPITQPPSPTPAAVPSEATAATPEGAAEFVRLWFETLNNAARGGDTTALAAFSDPQCETCNRFIESIRSLYESGGHIEGGIFTVTAVEAQAASAGAEETRAAVVYNVSPTRQVDAAGNTLREVAQLSDEAGDLVLARRGETWAMRDFTG